MLPCCSDAGWGDGVPVVCCRSGSVENSASCEADARTRRGQVSSSGDHCLANDADHFYSSTYWTVRIPSSSETKNAWPHSDYLSNPAYNNGTAMVWALVAGLTDTAQTLRHCGDPTLSDTATHDTGSIWIVDAPPPVAWPAVPDTPSEKNRRAAGMMSAEAENRAPKL